MCVYHHAELLDSGTGSNRVCTLLDQVSSVQANNVDSDDLACFLVEQNLGNTVSFTLGKRLGVGSEIALTLSKSPSLLFGHFDSLLLGWSNHGNFRVGEAGSRDGIVVDGMRTSNNVFNGRNSLSRCGVGKHHLAVSITNAIHVRENLATFVLGKHLHLLIDCHKSTLGFDAHCLQPHVGSVWDTSRCYHCRIHFDGFDMFLGFGVNHLDGDGLYSLDSGRDFSSKDPSTVIDRAVADQHALSLLCNLAVESRHQVWQSFDESDFTAQSGVNIREFEADVTRTNDGDPFRDELQLEGTVRRVDSLFVDSDAWGDKGH
mmetsp:Transcript_24585/g.70161  ORF Transcript_24585/g.70161 Transcript_24585/m.70161 type:complete len:317 (-) Transcript_24585:665-1615(-)